MAEVPPHAAAFVAPAATLLPRSFLGTGSFTERHSVGRRYRRPNHRPQACLQSALDNLKRIDDRFQPRKVERVNGTGEVFLVGTGPGDPGLLTLRAVQLLQTADVVLHDRLVSDEILSFIREGAIIICVGKGRGIGTGSQMSIQEQLLHYVALGKRVVRLKGGDPSVFGRVGEELQFLEDESPILLPVVVPGVTAASGVAASLGFPLTHGRLAHSVRFITGHLGDQSEFEIGHMPDGTTLVIYMGLQELQGLLAHLVTSGLDGDTPAVAVQSGTTSEQRVVWSRASCLHEDVQEAKLGSPTLIVVGDVVGMARGWRHLHG